MKRLVPVLITLFAATAVFAADVRKQTFNFAATGVDRVTVEIPVGDLVVRPSASNQIRVDMTLQCSSSKSRCSEKARDIELVSDRFGSSLDLDIEGYPEHGSGSLSVNLTIWMPAAATLRSETGVGDIDVKGLAGDIQLEVGVGDVTLNALESKVRSVHLEAGVGKARMFVKKHEIDVPGVLFLGHELDWNEGPGAGRIDVEAGVGSVRISLD